MDKDSFNFNCFFPIWGITLIILVSFSSLSELIRAAKTVAKWRNFKFILRNSSHTSVSQDRGPVGPNGKQSLQLQLSDGHYNTCIA